MEMLGAQTSSGLIYIHIMVLHVFHSANLVEKLFHLIESFQQNDKAIKSLLLVKWNGLLWKESVRFYSAFRSSFFWRTMAIPNAPHKITV